jgi:hypothetical protein
MAVLAGCAEGGGSNPDVSFGPVETVTVGARSLDVREASNDPVLRAALVASGTQMGDAMAVGGMPRNGAFAPADTIRVAGATGRDEAIAAVAAYCTARGVGVPAGLAAAVVRRDPATGESVVPLRCDG